MALRNVWGGRPYFMCDFTNNKTGPPSLSLAKFAYCVRAETEMQTDLLAPAGYGQRAKGAQLTSRAALRHAWNKEKLALTG